MASAIYELAMGIISRMKENSKVKKGAQINQNLSTDALAEVNWLKNLYSKGNPKAAYKLGKMYLDGEGVGYDPKEGEKYLKLAAQKDDFDAHYALALFYRGHWSYQHVDAYQSMIHYMAATHCKIDDARYMQEAKRAAYNDFSTKSTKDGLRVYFKVDIPIR